MGALHKPGHDRHEFVFDRALQRAEGLEAFRRIAGDLFEFHDQVLDHAELNPGITQESIRVIPDAEDGRVTAFCHRQDVGTVGLIGAEIRRLRVGRATVEGAFDISAVADARTVSAPAAGEPWAPLLGLTLPGFLATVRGAGDYLLRRAREHASGRVQFPGTFEDEGGRDTIAKFGAVKQMLAEMEAHRYVLETATMAPLASDDPWTSKAALKVLASDAFGPGERSITYLTGQVFGGTAFSEDDVIAKFYRDSAPFRFLLGHDDALRVEIGRARLGADVLVPVTERENTWLDEAGELGPLEQPVRRFRSALSILEAWADEAAGLDDDLGLHAAGTMVVRALAVRAVILRAAYRLTAGIPTVALVEAARLLADRLLADAPGFVEEAELARHTMGAGDALIEHGDFHPAPGITDAEPYSDIYTSDRAHGSGEWLTEGFDATHPRYVPEHLANDAHLGDYWKELETEFRERYSSQAFEDLPYGRWLEKLHLIPDADLDYMVSRGFMRMPIAAALGGEEALKARYYILCMLIGRYGDAALSLAIMANTSRETVSRALQLLIQKGIVEKDIGLPRLSQLINRKARHHADQHPGENVPRQFFVHCLLPRITCVHRVDARAPVGPSCGGSDRQWQCHALRGGA